MEKEKSQTMETSGQGFNSGLIIGLLVGAGCFWLTIKIVQVISH